MSDLKIFSFFPKNYLGFSGPKILVLPNYYNYLCLSLHNIKYPVNWVNKNDSKVRKDLRSCNVTVLKDTGTSKIQSASFYNDAARVWNQAPIQIKNCLSLSAVKRETKKYVKTLPI